MSKTVYLGDVFGGLIEEKLVLGQAEHREGLYTNTGGENNLYFPLSVDMIRIEPPVQSESNPEADNDFCLLDRPNLKTGVQVSINNRVGVISAKRQVVSVRIINDDTYLIGIPVNRLVEISGTKRFRQVLLNDCIGDIIAPVHKISLAFPITGSTCNINCRPGVELYPGQRMIVGLWALRHATNWNGSSLLRTWRIVQNAGTVATVTGVEVESLKVKWKQALPASKFMNFPPELLTRQNLDEVKYLPWRSDMCLGTIRGLQLTDEDLQNGTSEKNWIGQVLKPQENDESEGEPAARRQKLDNLKIGSVVPVEVKLVQNNVEVAFQTGEKEEMASIDIDEILTLNSIDIPRMEYVVKADQREFGHFGLCTGYYSGESECTPMNPKLNPQNMKQIQWFVMPDAAEPGRVETLGTEEVSVYDIECLNLSLALQNSSFLTRGYEDNDFSVGTFSKILDTGMIEIKDLDEKFVEKWPTEIEVVAERLNHQDLQDFEDTDDSTFQINVSYNFVSKICEQPTQGNAEDFLRTRPMDIKLMDKIVQLSTDTLEGEANGMDPEFYSPNTRQRNSLDKILEPRYNGLWIQCFENALPEKYVGFMTGQEGSILEDVLFKIGITVDTSFSDQVKCPVYALDFLSSLNKKFLHNWMKLQDVSYVALGGDAESDDRVLDGLLILRDNIHSTSFSTMRHGDNWLPIQENYPQLTSQEQFDWHTRWREVIGIQCIRYVFNSIAHPSGSFKDLVLGHYRHKIVGLLNRWNDWSRQSSQLFTNVSPGFVAAVTNQLKRFEPFTITSLVQNPDTLPEEEKSPNDLAITNGSSEADTSVAKNTNSTLECTLGNDDPEFHDPQAATLEAVQTNEDEPVEEAKETGLEIADEPMPTASLVLDDTQDQNPFQEMEETVDPIFQA